jgi:hypothetical protein
VDASAYPLQLLRVGFDRRTGHRLCALPLNNDDDVMGYTKKTEVIKKFLNRKREKAKQV